MGLLAIWSKIWPVLLAIIFFGLIVFIHELGHFLTAKLFKVKVNEFSIGMGPKILGFGKKDTRYSWRLFPIGGYVSMEGEDEESEDENSFANKKLWQRFIIVAAGAVMNIILGFVIVTVMMSTQDAIGSRTIAEFSKNAVTSQSLKENDKIIEINDRHVYSSYDLSFLLMRDNDATIDFKVIRDGKKVDVKNVKFNTAKPDKNSEASIVLDFSIYGVRPTFLNTIKVGYLTTISLGRMVWISLFDLITGQYGLNELSGPIGTVGYIANVAQTTVKTDITPLFMIMALITINIGIFNLLPIPALDGRRLFFMLIEMVRRKPVNQKYEKWIHAVGLILLLVFMVIISFSDILKLFRGGFNV